MSISHYIRKKLEEVLNKKVSSIQSLGGGCISSSFVCTLENKSKLFCKTIGQKTDMFEKEANGLKELLKQSEIIIPKVKYVDFEILLTDYIEIGSERSNFYDLFGKTFAKMHKVSNDYFGFYENNYIGSNKQMNLPVNSNWADFYFENRILFQYKLAEKNGYSSENMTSLIRKLESNINKILSGSKERPSLLHGDLWGGNFLVGKDGKPVLIDPAVYYGHREADLAMTKLFGGFNNNFYKAYDKEFPLPDGYKFRENIYKLYHILNHLNLFGSSYYGQAITLLKTPGYT